MTKMTMQAAKFYMGLGLRPIALMSGTKRPVDPNWQRIIVDDTYINNRFFGENNVGINLGSMSRNLLDVDLDHSSTITLAKHYLPSTDAIFGRKSRPTSHWLYFADLGDGERILRRRMFDITLSKDDTRLYLEIRGQEHQTMVPPSIHPSGEEVVWNRLGPNNAPQPRLYSQKQLEIVCARLATAAMLSDFYPGSGSRHEFHLGCSAVLFKAGWDLEDVDSFLINVAIAAGEDEIDDRRRAIHDTYRRVKDEGQTAGWSILKRLFPAPVLSAFRDWLELPSLAEFRFPLTDEGNAQRMVEYFGEDIRYVADSQMWATWEGSHWELSTGDTGARMMGFARQTAMKIQDEISEINDRKGQSALLKWSNTSGSYGRISAIPKMAKADPRILIGSAELDTDPWVLNCPNGVVDLRTGELLPHSKEAMNTKIAGAPYLPDAPAALWAQFLHRIMAGNNDMIGFLQRLVGYCLTGLVSEQIFPIFHGSGANGKSKFLEAVAGMLGTYARNADPETFMAKKNPGISSDVARLRGSRLVTTLETAQGRSLALTLIKQVTGGDRMTARFLYANEFEFDPTFKVIMATNNRPNIPETDHGTWRRIRLVPFNVQIPASEQRGNLGELLRAEYSGILAWAVRGCLEWQEHGLGVPAEVSEATEEYKVESDTVGVFLSEMCVTGADDDGNIFRCKALTLYNTYTMWCNRTNTRAMSGRVFRERLAEENIVTQNTDNGIEFVGLKIRHSDVSDYNPVMQVPNAGAALGLPSVFGTGR